MTNHKSEDYKLTAVEYYLIEDKSQEEVCKIFNCTPRSLMRWVDKYQETGNVERHNKKRKAYKLHKEHIKFLLNEIKKNKTTINDTKSEDENQDENEEAEEVRQDIIQLQLIIQDLRRKKKEEELLVNVEG